MTLSVIFFCRFNCKLRKEKDDDVVQTAGRQILGIFGGFSRVTSTCIFFYIQVIFHGQVALITKLSCFKYLVTYILVLSTRGFCKKGDIPLQCCFARCA